MLRRALWTPAVLLLSLGCSLSLPAQPEDRVALPTPCAVGQIPVAGEPWSCADPATLSTGQPAVHAATAAEADRVDFAQDVDEAAVADEAQGVSPSGQLVLGAAGLSAGGSSAALDVHGGANVLGKPVRFYIASVDLDHLGHVSLTDAGTPYAGPAFTLPPRPPSDVRPADAYRVTMRLTGVLEGKGQSAADNFSLCQVQAQVRYPDGGVAMEVDAQTGAYRSPDSPIAPFPVYGEATQTLSSGSYSLWAGLSVLGGGTSGPACTVEAPDTHLRVTFEGR
jgi:hypothetical protein